MDYKALYEQQLAENKELKEKVSKMSKGLVGNGILPLQEEIKKLKEEIKKYENRWKMFNVEQELEIKLLTAEYSSEEIRNCMEENKQLKVFKEDVIDATQCDNDLKDHEYIDYIKKIESEYDPEQHSSKDKDTNETWRAIKQISKLYQQNKKLKEENNTRKDIIYNLFSQRIQMADIDDGIDLSIEYGQKYIDEWLDIHKKIYEDVVETMNKCEFDDDGIYLEYNGGTHFDFCLYQSSDEED